MKNISSKNKAVQVGEIYLINFEYKRQGEIWDKESGRPYLVAQKRYHCAWLLPFSDPARPYLYEVLVELSDVIPYFGYSGLDKASKVVIDQPHLLGYSSLLTLPNGNRRSPTGVVKQYKMDEILDSLRMSIR